MEAQMRRIEFTRTPTKPYPGYAPKKGEQYELEEDQALRAVRRNDAIYVDDKDAIKPVREAPVTKADKAAERAAAEAEAKAVEERKAQAERDAAKKAKADAQTASAASAADNAKAAAKAKADADVASTKGDKK
jgi:hypothetical protein